jgi:hypothetical protein
MAKALTLSPKWLWLLLQSIDTRIASEEARYMREDPAEDADGDFGNDLWGLKLLRSELSAFYAAGAGTSTIYECWFDPQDNGLALLRFQDVQRNRDQGQLSESAALQYSFVPTPEKKRWQSTPSVKVGHPMCRWAARHHAHRVLPITIQKAMAIAGVAGMWGELGAIEANACTPMFGKPN